MARVESQPAVTKLDNTDASRYGYEGVFHAVTGEELPVEVPNTQFLEHGGNGTLRTLMNQPVVVYEQPSADQTWVNERLR